MLGDKGWLNTYENKIRDIKEVRVIKGSIIITVIISGISYKMNEKRKFS